MKITIIDFEHSKPEMLNDCLTRAHRTMKHPDSECVITCSPRQGPGDRVPGWCEYLMVYAFEDGSALTVGAFQRRPGAQTEFHS